MGDQADLNEVRNMVLRVAERLLSFTSGSLSSSKSSSKYREYNLLNI